MIALKITAVTANRQLWKITSWNVCRFSRNAKFPRPTNLVMCLFSMLR